MKNSITKIAIIRSFPNDLNKASYNVQEIGLAKGLLAQGISTDIYSCLKNIIEPEIIYKNGDNLIRIIPLSGINFLNKNAFYPDLSKAILSGQYDMVQLHEDSQIMTAWLVYICSKNNIKTILYQGMYSNFSGFNRIYQVLFDFLFKKKIQSGCNFFFSKTVGAKKYLELKGYSNIKVLPIGLDFEKEEKECSYKKSLDDFKSNHSKLLLYIGKIEERRNPRFLINILSELINDKLFNVGLVLIGDGPLIHDIISFSKECNVFAHILFIDNVLNEEINEVYRCCDLFLLPSNYEIYGMVVLEALYNGIPVISTPTAGPMDILSKKEFGCCLNLDVIKWVESIIYYFENRSDAIMLHDHINEHYNWNLIAKEYIKNISFK